MLLSILVLSVFTTYSSYYVQCEVINDPTLKPGNSNVEDDVQTLHEEFEKDFSLLNRDKVCKIVFHLTYAERIQLRDSFDAQFTVQFSANGEEFKSVTDVLSRISDNSLDKLYEISFIPWEDILVGVLRATITGTSDYWPIVDEVMCAEDNDMKKRVQDSYQRQFNIPLEEDVLQYKKDDAAYHEALIKYCLPQRAPELKISEQVANDAANALRQVENDNEAFKAKFKEILSKHTEGDLKLIFQKFRKGDGDGIDTTICKVFPKCDEGHAYHTLVMYIEDTCKYYADALYDSMDGFGTDMNRINRIVITRCERDLACIHKKYESIHGETYTERLKTDTTELRHLEAIRYLSGKPK